MDKMKQSERQKVIPSGKVYRQIFDAEVQLVNALEGSHDRKREDSSVDVAMTMGPVVSIPVVHDGRHSEAGGMLTGRQQTWMEGFPNESFVENPVLYKYYADEENARHREPESHISSGEVRGLPDVITPAKTGSDIIERIAESRRQRHEATVEDMHQDLGLISSNLEPQISAAGVELIKKLTTNDQFIDSLTEQFETDEDLARFSEPELHTLWTELASQSGVRQHWICELDEALSQIENSRMDKVRETLQNYADVLQKIASLMPPDLHKLLDKESQTINKTALSNRRAYADLYARLMMSDIEREKKLHTKWKQRLEDWKALHADMAVQKFRAYMDSETVLQPPNVQQVMQQMKHDQEMLNHTRVSLVNSLREMQPPSSTKTSVYHWNQQITEASKKIDSLNQEYFNKVYAEYEVVCQHCLEEIEVLKADLVDRGVGTQARIQQVVNEQCLPLVGERQSYFEKELETMDKALEDHNAATLAQLKSLFKYCQGAAHVWDAHELGLAKQERALQEKLDECRHHHDNQNQEKEANLDVVMDRMRQDANENALKESLKKSLEMLDKIKEGYFDFHTKQTDIVGSYPGMVQEELQRYDDTVCRFFGIDRKEPREGEQEVAEEESGASVRPKSKKEEKKQGVSRSSSRTSDSETKGHTSPLLSVSDIISTKKGTTYYVVTVGEDHGIPGETVVTMAKEQQQEEEHEQEDTKDADTFLTEVPPNGGDKQPSYIESVKLPDSILTDVKKIIRLNYLNHMEDWTEQAVQRSSMVVAAKTEELNSELDLRLHLHEPRAHRAELDVHNVRAAELVMHSERVARHCKGINQALNDLKQRFGHMTQEHNSLADKFRQDIQALEVIFINATKSSKLVSLSNQLQVEQDKYMDVIRSSLRQFRQHLDETLQMLRESNARFIKSFKVFSEGGNFCPEEIEEFRKKLEKMAHKIDSSEGFVMADLEGMESKRLEQATKISREFEDRFKHHMIDLLFMEKIARWLTNTQVKIKAEVADSNSQAQKCGQYLNDLERRIDACEKPNLDKEEVSSTQLNDGLKGIFEAYHYRSHYLCCLKGPSPRPTSAATMQGNPALGARVGFVAETTVPSISKPGKQHQEDPSVGVIRHILKTQKSRMKFGPDAELDGPDYGTRRESYYPNALQTSKPVQATSLSTTDQDRLERSKSRQSKVSDSDTRSHHLSSSKPGTATNSNAGEGVRRAQSGEYFKRKQTKIDKKYYVFGEAPEEGEETHFLGRTRHVLREALSGLLSSAELYYRQKGIRPVTRPQALQESFELCADVMVQKVQSYYTQSDNYHNQCLQEFRQQLARLEELVAKVPSCVVKDLLQQAIEGVMDERQMLKVKLDNKLKDWNMVKGVHQNELRPTLGHPQQVEPLGQLCARESERREEYLQGVEDHTNDSQRMAVQKAELFLQHLAGTSERLLLQLDSLLIVDEVIKGRVPPTKHATSELIRRKNAGLPLEDDEDNEKVPRGKKVWSGLPKGELVVPSDTPEPDTRAESRKKSSKQKKDASKQTASVTSAKTTVAHSATVEARDKAYQDYKIMFLKTLEDIDQEKATHVLAEERWTESWLDSVKRIKDLY